MDADVALKDFTDVPYVIERPAEPDLLADAAVSMLAKSGLRISFGKEAKDAAAHDLLVASALPDGLGFLSRRSAAVQCPAAATPSSVVSGPALSGGEAAGQEASAAMAFRTFYMMGRASGAMEPASAAAFASLMSVRHGAPEGTLSRCADRMAASGMEGTELVRSIDGAKSSLAARQDFLKAGASRIAKAAISYSDRNAEQATAAAGTYEDGFQKYVVKASLGGSAPSRLTDGMNGLSGEGSQPRFAAKPFGSMADGPSWLPRTFNESSRKEAQGIHPDLLKAIALAKTLSATDFEIVPRTGGVRSDSEQAHLKKAGRSRAKLGRHTIGHAVDLVPVGKRGRPDFGNLKGFDDIRDAMEAAAERLDVAIQWGGAWKMVDKPHFELDRKVYPGPGEEPDAGAVVAAFR